MVKTKGTFVWDYWKLRWFARNFPRFIAKHYSLSVFLSKKSLMLLCVMILYFLQVKDKIKNQNNVFSAFYSYWYLLIIPIKRTCFIKHIQLLMKPPARRKGWLVKCHWKWRCRYFPSFPVRKACFTFQLKGYNTLKTYKIFVFSLKVCSE